MKLFARLMKVDEERRLVTGRATQEVLDRSGEIFDYASSKPFFEKWSGDISKSTDGKSLGNLRAMHGNVAAGKLTAIDFNDADKAIDIVTKVVDEAEWQKVLEGVYTGFSIGGSYHKRWTDAEKAQRFTADPCEISLVDLPCVPTASFFDIQKVDGTVMHKVFKAAETPQTSAVDELAKLLDSGEVTPEDVVAMIKAKKEKDAEGEVEYADAANKKYPIDTDKHIRAAWSYINQEKNQKDYTAAEVDSIKAKIVAAWKKEIDKDGPPSAAEDDTKKAIVPVLTKAGKPVVLSTDNLFKAARLAVTKGMDRIASLAFLLGSIQSLQQGSAAEEAREGDDSSMPADLLEWLTQGGALLSAMVTEEVSEMVDAHGMVCTPDVYYAEWAASVDSLLKEAEAETDPHDFLHKVGARNSKNDKDRIQKAHDLMAQLGAGCDPGNTPADDEATKSAKAEALAKVADTEASLQKLTSDLTVANEALVKVADERDELAKARNAVMAERDDLAKAQETLTKERDDLTQEVTKLKAEPAAPKGFLRAISKSHDLVTEEGAPVEEEVSPILKQDGTVDEVATAIKKARRAGGVAVQRG